MKLLLKNWLIELKNMEQSLNRVYLNQQDYFLYLKKKFSK